MLHNVILLHIKSSILRQSTGFVQIETIHHFLLSKTRVLIIEKCNFKTWVAKYSDKAQCYRVINLQHLIIWALFGYFKYFYAPKSPFLKVTLYIFRQLTVCITVEIYTIYASFKTCHFPSRIGPSNLLIWIV